MLRSACLAILALHLAIVAAADVEAAGANSTELEYKTPGPGEKHRIFVKGFGERTGGERRPYLNPTHSAFDEYFASANDRLLNRHCRLVPLTVFHMTSDSQLSDAVQVEREYCFRTTDWDAEIVKYVEDVLNVTAGTHDLYQIVHVGRQCDVNSMYPFLAKSPAIHAGKPFRDDVYYLVPKEKEAAANVLKLFTKFALRLKCN